MAAAVGEGAAVPAATSEWRASPNPRIESNAFARRLTHGPLAARL